MMIKVDIERIVNEILTEQIDQFEDPGIFYVSSKVSSDNRISVFIDSMKGVNINDCAVLSRLIESLLDREKEDFELIVSSAGLDQPFLVFKQYEKNIGKQIKVKKSDGKPIKGKLIEVNESGITLIQIIKAPDKKGNSEKKTEIDFKDIKEAKVVITF